MSSTVDPRLVEPDSSQHAPATDTTHDEGLITFPHDRGQLPIETRRVLVQLLLGPAIDGRRQTKLWPVLLRDEGVIRSRLHELFLDLVIDPEQKVAFTRQVVAEGLDAPILLRRATLTFLESALLLHLRLRLIEADAQGERAVISLDEMIGYLSVFQPERTTDHAGFRRRQQGAVEKGKKLNILQSVRGAEERYEISPTLKLLFSAEEVQLLARSYEGLTNSSDPVDDLSGSADQPTVSDDA